MSELNGSLRSAQCVGCKREVWFAPEWIDLLHAQGRKARCLPCENPERYQWESITDQYGAREVIIPKSTIKRSEVKADKRTLLPGDAEAIKLRQVRLDLHLIETRKKHLVESIEKFQELLAEVQLREAEYRSQIPDLEKIVNEAFNDPMRETKYKAEALRQRIKELEADMAQFKKREQK